MPAAANNSLSGGVSVNEGCEEAEGAKPIGTNKERRNVPFSFFLFLSFSSLLPFLLPSLL